MLNFSQEELTNLGTLNTFNEIKQQGKLWQMAGENYFNIKMQLEKFSDKILSSHNKVRVIFTGAGTSAYVGDIASKYLNSFKNEKFIFTSIPTTDIVSNPKENLLDTPTLLVSFARSGNSPESLQSVNLADKMIKNVYHLAITCAKEGKLYLSLKDRDNSFNILMPDASNDKAFAMTSSFSCMLLTSLLIFDSLSDDTTKRKNIDKIIQDFNAVISRFDDIKKIVDTKDFDRVVYLGSGVFTPLTREAQLKLLELTAGKVATCYDSSMGFRHGPKSFVNEKTLVFCFVSDDSYTQKYDIDILKELYLDKQSANTIAITNKSLDMDFYEFSLNNKQDRDDILLVFSYITFAQVFAMLTSLKLKNTPDTPSKSGTVNRVVKGVTIHEF